MASVLVSGANKGIGLELCRQLSRRGDRVIATCRGDSPDLDSIDVRVVRGIDVAQDDSVDQLARALEAIPRLSEVNLALLGATATAADLTEAGYAIQNEMTGDFRISALGEHVLQERTTT